MEPNDNKHIPIIIGNYSPFRLILRENDNWNPTLEEINNKTYDYVKLSRLSGFIDVGIAPFSLAMGFDGSLILPAIPQYQDKEAPLNKFNETLAVLLLGGIYSEAMQPSDISYGSLFIDGYFKTHGGGESHNTSLHTGIRNKHIGISEVIKLLNPPSITNKNIEDAYFQGKQRFSHLGPLSPVLFLNGTSNYVKQQWTEALIFLWTTNEQLINIIWETEIIKKQSKKIIPGRRKFLEDYRTWSTSTKIEVLYQREYLDNDVYENLNIARKARNEFIHNGKQIRSTDAKSAMSALFHIMSLLISKFSDSNLLSPVFELVLNHERGSLFPQKTVFAKHEITHWLAIPPIPGDKEWGDKGYELIDAIRLHPLKKGI